jgi:hypothetical protein
MLRAKTTVYKMEDLVEAEERGRKVRIWGFGFRVSGFGFWVV